MFMLINLLIWIWQSKLFWMPKQIIQQPVMQWYFVSLYLIQPMFDNTIGVCLLFVLCAQSHYFSFNVCPFHHPQETLLVHNDLVQSGVLNELIMELQIKGWVFLNLRDKQSRINNKII